MTRRSPVLVLVHIVWSTKNRVPVLRPSIDVPLMAIMSEKANELGCALLAAGCADDHVHVVIRLAANVALSDLVKRIKGASAYELNRKAGTGSRIVWQRRYWAHAFGPEDLRAIARYVRDQRTHHDTKHPAEIWSTILDPT